jgi:hypothetical protein
MTDSSVWQECCVAYAEPFTSELLTVVANVRARASIPLRRVNDISERNLSRFCDMPISLTRHRQRGEISIIAIDYRQGRAWGTVKAFNIVLRQLFAGIDQTRHNFTPSEKLGFGTGSESGTGHSMRRNYALSWRRLLVYF